MPVTSGPSVRVGVLVVLLPLVLSCCRGHKSGNSVPCAEHYTIEDSAGLAALARCDSIDGLVTIQAQDWLTDLELTSLEDVGSLSILDNHALTRIDLPNLASVGGYVDFSNNSTLTAIHMPRLTTVPNSLLISDNDALTSPSGLSSLEAVGGHLFIENNACMSQTDAETISASVKVGGDSLVYGNGSKYPCN